MKDRFKFRVFISNKKNSKNSLTGIFKVHSLHTGTNKVIISSEYGNCSIKLGNNILMQCTDLKDKNDKLIYEGDIVNVYSSSEKLYRCQVKFEIGSFMLVSEEEIFDFPNKWNDNVYPLSQLYFEYENEENCIDQLEVIGNVYENPELLGMVR